MWEEVFAIIILGGIVGAVGFVLYDGYKFYRYFRDIYKQYRKDLAALTVDESPNEE